MEHNEDGTIDSEELTFEEVLEILNTCLDESGVQELNFNDD
jgi:hypothetical protein